MLAAELVSYSRAAAPAEHLLSLPHLSAVVSVPFALSLHLTSSVVIVSLTVSLTFSLSRSPSRLAAFNDRLSAAIHSLMMHHVVPSASVTAIDVDEAACEEAAENVQNAEASDSIRVTDITRALITTHRHTLTTHHHTLTTAAHHSAVPHHHPAPLTTAAHHSAPLSIAAHHSAPPSTTQHHSAHM